MIQCAQFYNSRIADNLTLSGAALRQTLASQSAYLGTAGTNSVQAMRMALGTVAKQLTQQANLLAYSDVYLGIGVFAIAACLPAFFLDTNNPKEPQVQGE